MKIYKVILQGYDHLENRTPCYTQQCGLFTSKGKALKKIQELKKKNPSYTIYNGKSYPIISVKEVEVE